MSNDLITLDTSIAPYDESALSVAMSSNAWLPRLQLMTSASDIVKEDKFPNNTFAVINGSDHKDVGKTCDVLVICCRPKAMEIGSEVISCHDPKVVDGKATGEFARIQMRADTEQNSGCMYGLEFLVWIPQIKQFATFFMGSASARKESGTVKALVRNAATLKPKKCGPNKKNQTWFIATAVPCSTPFDMPDPAKLKEEANKFLHPSEAKVGEAIVTGGEATSERVR